ncbi:154_t:CDS:2, partial [Entrophospora sp. SA101]
MLSWIIIISIVSLIGSLGAVKYGLEMKGKNNLKGILQKFKCKKNKDNQDKRDNYIWKSSSGFDLNSYLSKLLWNALALDFTITSLIFFATTPPEVVA